MKKLLHLVVLLVCFSVLVMPVFAAKINIKEMTGQVVKNNHNYVPGELLVKYEPMLSAVNAEYYQRQYGIATLKRFKSAGLQHVKLPKDLTVEQALEIYQSDPNVEYVEPCYYRYLTTKPNDTYFNWLWALHNTEQDVNGTRGTADADIDAPEAWNTTTGSNNVIVAVIDSGVDYNHPDLSANIWTNSGEIPNNGIDDDSNGYKDDYYGWDFIDSDSDPIDNNDHGTHIAGTIAAVGNNFQGVTGVCWRAKIITLKCADTFGIISTPDVISAIEYADNQGADVINMSFSGPDFSQNEKNTIDASSAVVVCAAGNAGSNNDITPVYPASYTSPNIIAVAATDQDDKLADFSNYGLISVDVAAPGVNIYSCQPGRTTVWSDNFDDGDISNWPTGGINNNWGTTNSESVSGAYSLTDSPGANYQNNTDSWARTPAIDLSSCQGTELEFQLRGDSEISFDGLVLETSIDLSNWLITPFGVPGVVIFSGISGSTSGSWINFTADLGSYDGENTFYARFRFISNATITNDGWYIDDVTVTAAAAAAKYQYFNGTSIATSHVSGLAALVKAFDPTLNNIKIKRSIENGVDNKTSLIGKVATDGRINAYGALQPSPPPKAPTVSTGAAVAILEDGATLQGIVNPNGAATSCYFEVGITTIYGKHSNTVSVGSSINSKDFECYIDDLDPKTTYHYRAVAYNKKGTTYGKDKTFKTKAATSGGGRRKIIDPIKLNLPDDGGGCFINSAFSK